MHVVWRAHNHLYTHTFKHTSMYTSVCVFYTAVRQHKKQVTVAAVDWGLVRQN